MIVVAAVEVLLWFPLMSGEDPSACCVPNRMSAISGPASHSFTETWRPGGEVGQLSGVTWAGLDGVHTGHRCGL